MLALEVKGLDYHQRRLDNTKREQKNAEYLKVNPRGQVPTLKHGDVTVCETLAILSYLDATYPDPPFFLKGQGKQRAPGRRSANVMETCGSPLATFPGRFFEAKFKNLPSKLTKRPSLSEMS
jgi:glutathione S-transferase